MADDVSYTTITREQADLFTGGVGLPTDLPEDDFTRIANACELSLRSLLCRSDSPLPSDPKYNTWLMLLAGWVKATYAAQKSGIDRTTAKSVRNFSVSKGNDGKVDLSDFYDNMSPLISMFSQCGSGVDFQTDLIPLIYAPDVTDIANRMPDAPPIFGGAI